MFKLVRSYLNRTGNKDDKKEREVSKEPANLEEEIEIVTVTVEFTLGPKINSDF